MRENQPKRPGSIGVSCAPKIVEIAMLIVPSFFILNLDVMSCHHIIPGSDSSSFHGLYRLADFNVGKALPSFPRITV